jgi:hypothetical protein
MAKKTKLKKNKHNRQIYKWEKSKEKSIKAVTDFVVLDDELDTLDVYETDGILVKFPIGTPIERVERTFDAMIPTDLYVELVAAGTL